ncbi:MAG: rhodanese-like domain-containing protein [Campylobacterota bacterium]|nr:rhodanese-like domain-containing protein [Campylobacterota bacterium]
MKKIILSSLLSASTLLANIITTLSTEQVQEAITEGVAIIDIRRVGEYKKYGIIKGSHKLTFFDNKGAYDIDKWMTKFTKIVKTKEQPFILVCAHANRTKVVGKFLKEEVKYTNVQELEGGINYGWIDKGLDTVK